MSAARRILLLCMPCLALFGVAPPARADYPDHPIKFILPFPPGGETDPLARAVSQQMSKILHQSIVIENRAGAAGNIASQVVAAAPKDGYTLLWGFSNWLVINPLLYKDLTFSVARDFAPISSVADGVFVLLVNPKVPAKSVKDLITYAQANPGKLNYASTGVGSPLYLAAVLFAARSHSSMVNISYKGGGDAALAVMSGDCDLVFSSPSASGSFIKGGKLRALAVTSPQRIPLMPDLPTVSESGMPGFSVTSWHSLLAPAGTPKAIIDKLHAAVIEALATPEVQEDGKRQGLVITGSTPAQVADRIKAETAMWREVLHGAGVATVQ